MVCGMSQRRFRHTLGGVLSLGLHVVWCRKYRRRILGGRVARRDAPGSLVRAVKDRIAGGVRQEFAHLRNHAKVSQSSSCLAASVGDVWESRVGRDIERWSDAVIAS
jgi:REP-associated tyrosine transposase